MQRACMAKRQNLEILRTSISHYFFVRGSISNRFSSRVPRFGGEDLGNIPDKMLQNQDMF